MFTHTENKHLLADMEAGTLSIELALDLQKRLRDNIIGKPLTDERLMYEQAVRPLADYIAKKVAEQDHKSLEDREAQARQIIHEAEERALKSNRFQDREIVYRARHERFVKENNIQDDDPRIVFDIEQYEPSKAADTTT